MKRSNDLIIKTPISSSPERTLDAAREALEKWGGSLKGDLESGEVVAKTPVGAVVGHYEIERNGIEGAVLTMRVVKRPRLAPDAVVRSVIEGFFANLPR